MYAKKSYGQHFLNKPEIAENIANGLKLTDTTKRVLEIGPGQGMLTQYLLKNDYELVAVEADKDMVAVLEKKFPFSFSHKQGDETVKNRILFEDFMKTDLTKVFNNQPFSLIGNFPYNISSQIIFKMIDNRVLIPEMVGMFQLEVADRAISKPGGKDYGILSVLVQAYYEGTKLFNVDKSCFSPPPQVQSAVIRLERKANQDLDCDEVLFKKVVKQAFSQRRKMLRNTLKPFFEKEPTQLMSDPFYTKRPETLGLEEYVRLTNQIMKMREEV
jgi:16S rRNA (adenine1518-N6/adenine1519-N6)-dimethyltransferase